jgi:hypothetical protein
VRGFISMWVTDSGRYSDTCHGIKSAPTTHQCHAVQVRCPPCPELQGLQVQATAWCGRDWCGIMYINQREALSICMGSCSPCQGWPAKDAWSGRKPLPPSLLIACAVPPVSNPSILSVYSARLAQPQVHASHILAPGHTFDSPHIPEPRSHLGSRPSLCHSTCACTCRW